ncbi:DUF2797 domain-containing protein, partial [Streptomyces mirabilis]
MAQTWRCSGLRWSADGPVLMWGGGRGSALSWGKRVAFGVVDEGVRTCVGARGNACPVRAVVSGRSAGARCEEWARRGRPPTRGADPKAAHPPPDPGDRPGVGPRRVKGGV